MAEISIIGAGAIGCLVGAHLVRAGHQVHFLARGAQLDALARDGLRYTDDHGAAFTLPVRACGSIDDLPRGGIALMTLKGHQIAPLAEAIAGRWRDGTIVAVQNGIPWWFTQGQPGFGPGAGLVATDPDGRLGRAFSASRIVGAVAYMSGEVVAPGHLHQIHIHDERMTLGVPQGPLDVARQAAEVLTTRTVPFEADADIRRVIWAKLMANICLNPVCALTLATVGIVAKDPRTGPLIRQMMEEMCAIADAAGTSGLDALINERIAHFRGRDATKPSMFQDVERGRAMELGPILAAPLEMAERLGVGVPALRAVHALAHLRNASLG